MLKRAGGCGLDPHHLTAGNAYCPRKPIDGWYDVASGGNLNRKALGDEIVLHVNHHQRGADSVDFIMVHELALPAKQALLDGIGNHIAVHRVHSALTPERLTTSAHFSVSAAMKAVSSAGVKKIGTQATLSRRLRTAGSARPALIT